ncbi:MAG TPA: hypothetical protein VMV94_04985 [Phycisphaerae bacterium]|nr:hypothetical protein [Phycisphaerae bacterium]
MQCWNCGFENIPGLKACARCASALCLDDISVEPPRSSTLHLATQVDRASNRLKSAFPYFTRFFDWMAGLFPVLSEALALLVSWRSLLWSLIPGLAQIKTRRPRIGWILLSIWLVLLLVAIVSIATDWTWYLVNAMVLVHAVSVTSLLVEELAFERQIIRAAFGVCLFFTLSYCLYRPVTTLLSRWYQPIVVPAQIRGGGFVEGDGIICQGPWRRPAQYARGDVVLYAVSSYQRTGFYVPEGLGLDRIVGVPGDYVQTREGRLLVNGADPAKGQAPLGAIPRHFADLDIHLAAGEYAILPSSFSCTYHGNAAQLTWPPDLARQLMVIPYEDVLGRAVFRIHPLSRFGRIE